MSHILENQIDCLCVVRHSPNPMEQEAMKIFFVAKLWLYKNNLTFVFAIQNKHLGHI